MVSESTIDGRNREVVEEVTFPNVICAFSFRGPALWAWFLVNSYGSNSENTVVLPFHDPSLTSYWLFHKLILICQRLSSRSLSHVIHEPVNQFPITPSRSPTPSRSLMTHPFSQPPQLARSWCCPINPFVRYHIHSLPSIVGTLRLLQPCHRASGVS